MVTDGGCPYLDECWVTYRFVESLYCDKYYTVCQLYSDNKWKKKPPVKFYCVNKYSL